MTDILNQDNIYLNENRNYRFNRIPLITPNLSKIMKNRLKNNLMQRKNVQRGRDKLFFDLQRNSINNFDNYSLNLPNISTSFTPIEKRSHAVPTNKSVQNNNIRRYISRNLDTLIPNYNSDYLNLFENKEIVRTLQLKRYNQMKYAKNNENDSYSRNNLYTNYLSHNDINLMNKINNYNKMKFTINKKNLMNTLKKPSKINIEKKNFKYKIPLDAMNNFGRKKLVQQTSEEDQNDILSSNNNIIKRNNKSISFISPMNQNKDFIDYNKEDINIKEDPKTFIESTLIAFNGLVSQAQELGQVLIDNKELINLINQNENNHDNDKDNGNENDIDNDNEVKVEMDKLNMELKTGYKTVEELQKINTDLNNKINFFNKNTQQYKDKVKELVSIINQIKNDNNGCNFNSNIDNVNSNINNNNITQSNNNNFNLENKPKKKKLKFGFVELIFMKDDKFEVIQKPKMPKYYASQNEFFTINKIHKEPKLVFVNINKNNNVNDNNKVDKTTMEEYMDAASQMANHIIIESLNSIQNEDKNY